MLIPNRCDHKKIVVIHLSPTRMVLQCKKCLARQEAKRTANGPWMIVSSQPGNSVYVLN